MELPSLSRMDVVNPHPKTRTNAAVEGHAPPGVQSARRPGSESNTNARIRELVKNLATVLGAEGDHDSRPGRPSNTRSAMPIGCVQWWSGWSESAPAINS